MPPNPGTVANLPVILVKIPVDLLVKLTKLGQGGHGGGLTPPDEPLPGPIMGAETLTVLGYRLDYQLLAETTGNTSQTIGNVVGNWLDYVSFLPILSDFLGITFQSLVEFHSHGYFLCEYMFFFQKSSSGGIATLKMQYSSRRTRFQYSQSVQRLVGDSF